MSDATFFPMEKIRAAIAEGKDRIRNRYGDSVRHRPDLYCRVCGQQDIWEKTGDDYYHGTGTVCAVCEAYDCCTPEESSRSRPDTEIGTLS